MKATIAEKLFEAMTILTSALQKQGISPDAINGIIKLADILNAAEGPRGRPSHHVVQLEATVRDLQTRLATLERRTGIKAFQA